MWATVRPLLKGLDPVRVENRVEAGTPDVNCVPCWIELKIGYAPKRGGILRIDHWTPEQKTWHTRRIHAGGKVFLLLKVSNEWILLTGLSAVEYLDKVSLDKLREVAIKTWKPKIQGEELRAILLQ